MAVNGDHRRRRLLVGANAGIATAIAVVIAFLLADIAARQHVRWDLSADSVGTLRPETLGTLDALDRSGADVTITAFSAQARDAEGAVRNRVVRDFLAEMALRTAHLKTAFVDLDVDRQVAEGKGVDRYGTVVVEGRGERIDVVDRELFRTRGSKADRQVDFIGEGALSRAVAQVLADDPRHAYFLVGHGERRRDGGGAGGVSLFASLLVAQGWDVAELDMLRGKDVTGPPTVPADADVVFVFGPTGPLTPEEDAAVGAYLQHGGRVGYFVDPGDFVADFIETVGVSIPTGSVQDEARFLPHDDRPVLRFHPHPVTQPLIDADTAVVVAYAAPIRVEPHPGVDAVDLLVTSREGWLERGDERPPVHDPSDGEGPVSAAVAIDIPREDGPPARLAVVGDVDVATDELIAEGPGNAAFAVNLARWLVGDEDRAGLVGRPSAVRVVALSEDRFATLGVLLVGVWPTVFLAIGAAVSFARRER